MKKELYYIRGNAERADEVKAALLEKYPDLKIDSDYTRFTQPECLYYNHNGFADYVKPSEIATMDLLKACGTELHLPEKIKAVMSKDRRPLTEYECIDIAYQYLIRKLAETEDDVLTIAYEGKPVLRIELLDKKGGDDE